VGIVRTALIGYGLAGRVIHRPLLLAEPRMQVTHVVTRDPVRRAQAAADLPAARLVQDPDELWRCADEFDAVVVATSNDAHVPLALAALSRGKATVVDKPLAITAADAERICAAAGGVPLSVFHNRRWDSDTLAGQALLASGTLGTLVRLESRFTRFRPQVPARWREDAAAGGGVLLDLGTHVVDQAVHLLGPVTEVYAEVGVRRTGARVDDDCFLALAHATGVRSHVWASMVAAVPGPRLLLQGTAGGWSKADLDGQEDHLQLGWTPADGPVPEPPGVLVDAKGSREVDSPPGDWAAYYRLFAAAVLDGGPVPVPASDGVAVLRVLEAARLSSERSAVVPLSPAG
jgi:predicted dehydrogenase